MPNPLTPNPEVVRFVKHVGGNGPAAEILECSKDMVRQLKTGGRTITPKYIRSMYHTKGFRISLKRVLLLE